MRIAILGAGSIGTLFGVRLYKAGNEVTLYNRNRKIVKAVKRTGVRLRTKDRTFRVKIPISEPPRTLRGFDLIIVTVKAYNTKDVARRYRGKLGEGTALSIQNGLGNYETLSDSLGESRVVAGSTTEAALSLQPGSVVHMGTGQTWIGEYNGRGSEKTHTITKLFRSAGFDANHAENIRQILWTKAVMNSAINPISALTWLPNGKLGAFKLLMNQIIDEGVRAAEGEGASLHAPYIKRLTSIVLRRTGDNRSSMLQDIENDKRTEIEQLNGAISEAGRKHLVRTPLNLLLLKLVLDSESTNSLGGTK